MNIVVKCFSLLGFCCLVLFSIALYLDIQEMDKTEGGYEFPYATASGEVINWDSMDQSSTGLVRRGYVLNFLVNATTGMITLELFGIPFNARKLSPRALVVHKPRDAFIRRGFVPTF